MNGEFVKETITKPKSIKQPKAVNEGSMKFGKKLTNIS